MKRIMTIAAAAALICACGQKEKTVDFPTVDASTTTSIIIEKVEMTDSLTTLHIRGYNQPGWWINVVPETRLEADGKIYEMVGTERCEPNVYMWMPADGDSSFVLKFKPLPLKTKKFDFVEGDVEGAWRLIGVNLTGKPSSIYDKGVPSHVKETPATVTETPGFVYDLGETTLNIRFLGYKPSLGNSVALYTNSILGTQNEHNVNIDPETGTAKVTFDQYGTVHGFMIMDNRSIGEFRVAPGETADIYCDLSYMDYLSSIYNRTDKPVVPKKPLYTDGSIYDFVNNLPVDDALSEVYINSIYSNPDTYALDADEFTDLVIREYEETINKLNGMEVHPVAKALKEAEMKLECIYALGIADYVRESGYRMANGKSYDEPVDYVPDPVTEKHINRLTDMFDLTDPLLLICEQSNVLREIKCEKDNPEKYGNLRYMRDAIMGILLAENAQLSDEKLAEMREWDEPFFFRVCEDVQKKAVEALASGKDKIQQTPDVPLDKLFESIVAQHKGKVVLVDFWNTWCGPCRSAIKHNEPYKTGELADEDLVWVYIANETSPMGKYLEMIPEIKGMHYRLNDAQWRQLTSKDFDLDGIPSYVLVKKDGTYALRNDFRDHSLLVSTLKSELD